MPSNTQLTAIRHINGPAMVIAGPGSGKTFTIVQRLKYLIYEAKIKPENILVVTFSKAAAKEMADRFYEEVNVIGIHFGTFHSVAYNILKKSFNFNSDSLITNLEKIKLLTQLLKNYGLNDICNEENIINILNGISKHKNSYEYKNLINKSFIEEISDELFIKIISDYEEFKHQMNKLDFDDMIINCINSLNRNTEILKELNNEYQYILVDEFQDINYPQFELIKMLSKPLNNLFVVGDDDQSIYKFRGSDSHIMNQFIYEYPDIKKIFLTENYRCGKNIVEFANKIIVKNDDRFRKEFVPKVEGGNIIFNSFLSRKAEEDYVLKILNSMNETKRQNTALILRTNLEVNLYRQLLINNKLINKQNKQDKNIKESFIMKDIYNFLLFIYDGFKRENFLVFMNKPNKYIQRSALLNEAVIKEDLIRYYKSNKDMLYEIEKFFDKLKLASSMNPKLAISLFVNSIGYGKYIKDISKSKQDYELNLKILNEVTDIFSNYRLKDNIKEFYDSISAVEDVKKIDNNDEINIITMHSAKGLEFETVILPDINEGVIPPKNCTLSQISEERRLLYVAVTRAKKDLYILSNAERNRKISRFVHGII